MRLRLFPVDEFKGAEMEYGQMSTRFVKIIYTGAEFETLKST